MALDVPPKPLGKVFDHFHLIFSPHGCPSLAFKMANSLSQPRRELSPPHPPLHISASQLHFSLLCHDRMQENLLQQQEKSINICFISPSLHVQEMILFISYANN
jgi:hypothetical protein